MMVILRNPNLSSRPLLAYLEIRHQADCDMFQVLTASFIIRVFTLPFTKDAPLPQSMISGLPEYAPNFYKWAQAVMKHPSVNSIYNQDACAAEMRDRRAKARANASA